MMGRFLCRFGWHRWYESKRIQWWDNNAGVGKAKVTDRCDRRGCDAQRERFVSGLTRRNPDIVIP